MCLFTKGRNAVIAVIDLALHEENGPVALPGLCQRTGLSLSYLESIFRKLRCYGIVLTIRGPHGGFLLARAIEELKVAEIISAMGKSHATPAMDIKGKLPEPGRRQTAKGAAHDLWASVNNQLIDYLKTISIKDLIDQQRAMQH